VNQQKYTATNRELLLCVVAATADAPPKTNRESAVKNSIKNKIELIE
jgi:hypothetical protein